MSERIQDAVRNGKVSAAQGALLMEMRRELHQARQPWWRRLTRAVFGW